jgi:hypothetical protein
MVPMRDVYEATLNLGGSWEQMAEKTIGARLILHLPQYPAQGNSPVKRWMNRVRYSPQFDTRLTTR